MTRLIATKAIRTGWVRLTNTRTKHVDVICIVAGRVAVAHGPGTAAFMLSRRVGDRWADVWEFFSEVDDLEFEVVR